jgi:hypothetical protein
MVKKIKNTNFCQLLWTKLGDDCSEKINGGISPVDTIGTIGTVGTIGTINISRISRTNNNGTQKNDVILIDSKESLISQVNLP